MKTSLMRFASSRLLLLFHALKLPRRRRCRLSRDFLLLKIMARHHPLMPQQPNQAHRCSGQRTLSPACFLWDVTAAARTTATTTAITPALCVAAFKLLLLQRKTLRRNLQLCLAKKVEAASAATLQHHHHHNMNQSYLCTLMHIVHCTLYLATFVLVH